MSADTENPAGVDRWVGKVSVAQAIEAFTKYPGLSPTARLLGIELVSRFNAHTGECYPSRQYLAAALGVSERQVTRAKNELLRDGLINWHDGGHRGRACQYGIPWRRLKESLAEFRANWARQAGIDDRSLVMLHNDLQVSKEGHLRHSVEGDNGGHDCHPVEPKGDIPILNGGHICPERMTPESPLLSHENTHNVHKRVADVETSSPSGADPQTVSTRQEQTTSVVSIGRKGIEETSVRSPPQCDTDMARCRARASIWSSLGTLVRNETSAETMEQGIDIALRDGDIAAVNFINKQWRPHRQECVG